MNRTSLFGPALSLVLAASFAAALPACDEEADPNDVDTGIDASGEADLTLGETLDALGLGAGSYVCESPTTPVCVATYRYPGGAVVTEEVGLSGFERFELRVSGTALSLFGAHDELGAVWDEASGCVIFDASQDTRTNHTECEPTAAGEGAPCTPFDLVRFCAGDSGPTFAARVPECGEHRYDVSVAP
jgi:hypothetical protein